MKRKYEKPVFYAETISVSDRIANCEIAVGFTDGNRKCRYHIGQITVFHSYCRYNISEKGDQYDKLCYHVPCGQGSFFQS